MHKDNIKDISHGYFIWITMDKIGYILDNTCKFERDQCCGYSIWITMDIIGYFFG